MSRAALIVLSAALYAVAAPPWSLDVVAPVALTPLVVALDGVSRRRGALLGFAFGCTAAALVAWWTVGMISRFFATGLVVGLAASIVVWVLTAGLPFCLFGALAPSLLARRRPLPLLTVPAVWVGCELVRTHAFTGLPWELLGHLLYRRTTLIQLADVTGAYGLSFLCAASAVGVADAVRAGRRGAPVRAAAAAALGGVAALWLAAHAYGAYRLGTLDRMRAPSMPVAVVQANRAPARHVSAVTADATLRAYLHLSRERVAPRTAELVVWPENTAGYYLSDDPHPLGTLTRFARDRDATLLVGGLREGADGAIHNAAYAIGGQGILGAHDKVRLVPFAEYAPLGLAALAAPAAVLAPGDGPRPVPHARAPLGVLICYEILYPGLARTLVREGARVLVNIANDAWSDPTGRGAAWQTLSMAVFRAVETRRWVVRAATTGVSGIVAPTGRTERLIGAREVGVARADVGLPSGLTPYVRLGDVFAWACAALGLAAAMLRRPGGVAS